MKTLTERYKRVTAHHLDQLHDALATLHEKAEGAKTDADARHVLKRIERYQRDLSGLVLSHAKGIADTARHFPMDENGRAFQADVEAIDRAVTEILNQRPHTSAQARQWAEDFWTSVDSSLRDRRHSALPGEDGASPEARPGERHPRSGDAPGAGWAIHRHRGRGRHC